MQCTISNNQAFKKKIKGRIPESDDFVQKFWENAQQKIALIKKAKKPKKIEFEKTIKALQAFQSIALQYPKKYSDWKNQANKQIEKLEALK